MDERDDLGSRLLGFAAAFGGELSALLWPPGCRVCGADLVDEVGCKDHGLGDLIRPIAVGEYAGARFVGGARSGLLGALGLGRALDREVPRGGTWDGIARCGLCSRRLPPGVRCDRLVAPPWMPSGVGNRTASWRRCRMCRLEAPGFGRLLAVGDYPGELRPWVLALKHGRRDLAGVLARLLAERLEVAGWLGQRALLVPVPSHPLRKLERGIDAPFVLAKALGREIGWPVERGLKRLGYTTPQGEPGSVSRTANVHGVFVLRRGGLREALPLILVDDVVSSGATLAECARVLRSAKSASGKPRQVGAVCLARALRAK